MSKQGRSIEQRFIDSVIRAENGCWLWQLRRSASGYGYVNFDHRNRQAHRLSYEVFVGPIPEGLTIDHLCRVRHCVNPEHLEPVTMRENTLRGDTLPARNAAKTHCPKGHPFDEANTRRWRNHRTCRTCQAAWARQRNAVAA